VRGSRKWLLIFLRNPPISTPFSFCVSVACPFFCGQLIAVLFLCPLNPIDRCPPPHLLTDFFTGTRRTPPPPDSYQGSPSVSATSPSRSWARAPFQPYFWRYCPPFPASSASSKGCLRVRNLNLVNPWPDFFFLVETSLEGNL